jgi:hypothetical protein
MRDLITSLLFGLAVGLFTFLAVYIAIKLTVAW